MELKADAVASVPYSDSERELFAMLSFGAARAVSTKDLVEKRYGMDHPFHALSIIRATMGSLTRKIEINEEPFRISKSVRSGPHPISFWLDREKKR